MNTPDAIIAQIPVAEIRDWESFHDTFARVLGFPAFYGRNMDAWIDCMTSVDAPEHGMTSIHGARGGMFVLQLGDCTEFAQRCPEQYEALLDCTAFVNYRRIDVGQKPVLVLSFHNREPVLSSKRPN